MARNTGMVALEAEDVSITTATVTIRAIQVNNRQMTQSVFRQLPARPLVDERKVELIGLPWGWVNYNPGDGVNCRQFVAQFGAALSRCPTRLIRSWDFESRSTHELPAGSRDLSSAYHRAAFCWAVASILAGDAPESMIASNRYPVEERYPFAGFDISLDGSVLSGEKWAASVFRYPYPDIKCEWDATNDRYTRDEVPGSAARRKAEAQAKLCAMMAARGHPPDAGPAAMRGQLDAIAAAAIDYRRRWDLLMDRLEAVEQLFIAC